MGKFGAWAWFPRWKNLTSGLPRGAWRLATLEEMDTWRTRIGRRLAALTEQGKIRGPLVQMARGEWWRRLSGVQLSRTNLGADWLEGLRTGPRRAGGTRALARAGGGMNAPCWAPWWREARLYARGGREQRHGPRWSLMWRTNPWADWAIWPCGSPIGRLIWHLADFLGFWSSFYIFDRISSSFNLAK